LRYLTFLLLFLTFYPAESVLAKIFAEDVGGTQYGTGHLAAAQKYKERVDDIAKREKWSPEFKERLYLSLEEMLCSHKNDMAVILRSNFHSPGERKTLFRTIFELQDTDQKKVVQLLMIGKDRAVAVDGHHRIRTRVQLSNILKVSNNLWPEEVKSTMTSAGRLKKNGDLKWSLPIENPQVIGELPGDAKAREIMRALLKQNMGLWKDPADMAMAKSFFGKKSKNASKNDLQYLASKLGIVDSPSGVRYIQVTDLPDASMRTVMGNYFRTRGMKSDKITFQAYVEFYLGDEVKQKVLQNPGKYPMLGRILDPDAPIMKQKLLMDTALDEIDKLFSDFEEMKAKTTDLTITGSRRVENTLEKIRFFKCGRASAMELDQ